jgi:hypothetical protein
MPKRSRKPKKKDVNEIAAAIVDVIASMDENPQKLIKNPAAVELGRLGGKKGGKARAKKLSAERRKEIAKKAAEARWSKPQTGTQWTKKKKTK